MFLGIKKLMNPGGALCINYFGSLAHEHAFGTNSLAKTLKQVFAQVVAFTNLPPGDIGGNIYFLATDERRDPGQLIEIDQSRCFYSVYGDLCKLWEHKIDFNKDWEHKTDFRKDMDSGIVLTDAYNPIAFYDAGTREEVRKKMQTLLGRVLL